MYQRIISLILSLFLPLSASGCAPSAQPGQTDREPISAVEPQLPEGGTAETPPGKKPLPSAPEDPSDGQSAPEEVPAQPGEETPPAETAPEEGASRPAPDPEKPMVALTFDDGPHAVYTDQLLDILEENGAVATFFEVGRNLSNDPDAVRRAAAMGCEIGSHSYRHADLGKMGAEDIAADLQRADEQFTAVLGYAPTLLRPPYGSMNSAVKYTTGRSVVTWSIDTEDWRSRNVEKILASVQGAGDLNGHVILMHSSYDTSVEAARQLVPWLLAEGYQLVTVTELITLHYGDPVVPNGTYGYSYFTFGKDVILPPGVELPEPQEPPAPQPETGTPPPSDPGGEDAAVVPEEPQLPADGTASPVPGDGSGTAPSEIGRI